MLKHLKEEKITYFEHMKRALSISFYLFLAGFFCFVHAFFPDLFCKSASNLIIKLNKEFFEK